MAGSEVTWEEKKRSCQDLLAVVLYKSSQESKAVDSRTF